MKLVLGAFVSGVCAKKYQFVGRACLKSRHPAVDEARRESDLYAMGNFTLEEIDHGTQRKVDVNFARFLGLVSDNLSAFIGAVLCF